MAELQITSMDEKLTLPAIDVMKTVMQWFSLHSRVLPAQQERKKDAGDNGDVDVPILCDCTICLCEVAPEEEDGSKKLPNCEHGVQFHSECIESWLKDHPTCPLCRTHVSRPVHLRLKAYLIKLGIDMVSYCNDALENMASSIVECNDS